MSMEMKRPPVLVSQRGRGAYLAHHRKPGGKTAMSTGSIRSNCEISSTDGSAPARIANARQRFRIPKYRCVALTHNGI